jgi:hypothetical protein
MYRGLGWEYLVSDEKDEGTELPAALQSPTSSSSAPATAPSSSASSSDVNLFEIPPPSSSYSSSSSSVSLVQSAMDAFMSSDMDHTKKLLFVERYQHMESSLKEYLKKLKESGVTTVTAEVRTNQ